jgi:GH24 family phage-related lysozyme (muramidase)
LIIEFNFVAVPRQIRINFLNFDYRGESKELTPPLLSLGSSKMPRGKILNKQFGFAPRKSERKVVHTLSEAGLNLIKSFEGFRPNIYDDGTGTMTIGYGTTSADVDPLPTHLTEPQAAALLAKKLAEKYEPAIHNLHIPFNQHQFDALVSVAYNLGTGVLVPPHDLGVALAQHKFIDVPRILLEYDDPGTAEQAGLERRRIAEGKMFAEE